MKVVFLDKDGVLNSDEYFDKIEVNDVLNKEQELYTYLDSNETAQSLLQEVKSTKQLPSDESLKNVLNNFFR